MRIDGYEVNNGHVIAVFITDKKRNMKQHKYEPARPHGEWILHCPNRVIWYECSVCHAERAEKGKFCDECGADMREGESN